MARRYSESDALNEVPPDDAWDRLGDALQDMADRIRALEERMGRLEDRINI